MYYVKRHNSGIIVKDSSNEHVLNIGIKGYINSLCLKNLSTFDGRKTAATRFLKQKDNIPIYVDSSTFLYPTKSLREYSVVFVNYFEVLSIRKISNTSTLLIFNNLEKLIINLSIKRVMKQHLRIENIIEHFNIVS